MTAPGRPADDLAYISHTGKESGPYRFDLEKARALLAKAGLPTGFGVTMDVRNNSPTTDIAQTIQASWAKAGVKLDLIPANPSRLR